MFLLSIWAPNRSLDLYNYAYYNNIVPSIV